MGDWLDDRFDTHPWLTLTFLLLGVVAGFRSLWRLAQKAARDEGLNTPEDDGESGRDGSGG